MRSGFITIAGKPNSGKSTLTNALVGEKVSIVSGKPQTTRNRVIGIVNKEIDGEQYQAVLVDTPGIHKPRNMLSEFMMKSVDVALEGMDVVIYILACDKKPDEHDDAYINRFAKSKTPFILVINKCDEVEEKSIIERIERYKDVEGITAIIPISALRGKNVDMLENEIMKLLPEGERFYSEDMYTDRSLRFLCSEIVREKALRLLGDEVPYGIGVSINKFEEREDGVVEIDCDVICEKQAHKAIVIGKGGEMIKKISTSARIDMEKLLDAKVFLTLYVRVKPDWRDNRSVMGELGYDKKNI